MERAEKRDGPRAMGMPAGKLEPCFNRLGPLLVKNTRFGLSPGASFASRSARSICG